MVKSRDYTACSKSASVASGSGVERREQHWEGSVQVFNLAKEFLTQG